jgi:TonB family protein
MLLLGLALLLQVGTKDLAPEKKVAAGVKLDVADKNFSVATKDADEQAAVVKALEHGLDGVRECWKIELESHPKAHGTVTLAFTILPDGSLSRPVLKSDTVNDKALVDCSTKTLGATTTQIADKTIRVVAPLVFTNGSENATTSGTVSPKETPEGEAAVDQVLTKSRQEFNNCYSLAKRKDPRAAGTIVIDFTIEENGSVREATISGGTMSSMPMNTCSAKAMRHMKFPPPPAGRAQFTRTLTFPAAK